MPSFGSMIALTPIDLYVRKSRTNGIYNHICFILICIYTIYDYTTDIGLASYCTVYDPNYLDHKPTKACPLYGLPNHFMRFVSKQHLHPGIYKCNNAI